MTVSTWRAGVLLLSPFVAVPSPSIGEVDEFSLPFRHTAEKQSAQSFTVVSHGMEGTGKWTAVGNLCPSLAIPFPSITENELSFNNSNFRSSTEQDCALAGSIVGERMAYARQRPHVSHLYPFATIPFPCVIRQCRICPSAKEQDATTCSVKNHCSTVAGRRPNVLFLRPEKMCHGGDSTHR